MVLILPGWGTSPVCIKGLLYLFHLLDSSLLSVTLHTCVNGSVYFKTFCIECVGALFTIVLTAPVFHPFCYSLAEIVGITVIRILDTVFKLDVFCT